MRNWQPHRLFDLFAHFVANISAVISRTTFYRAPLLVLAVLMLVLGTTTTSFANRSVYLGSADRALIGSEIEIPIVYVNPHSDQSVTQCELLLSFPSDVVTFVEVIPTPRDFRCGWVYFNVSQPAANLIRISAQSETGLSNCLNSDSTLLAIVKFQVTDDRAMECQGGLLSFRWQDCTDNMFVSEDGSTSILSDTLYADPHTWPAPASGRGATDSCVAEVGGIRGVNFYVGTIDITCADSIDNRGDVNLNGIAYEIADYLMFTNYFIVGLDAFGDYKSVSAAATDINSDGFYLKLTDLVYMQKVVVGDTLPLPRISVTDTVRILQDMSAQTIGLDYAPGLAALLIKFEGDIVATPLFDTAPGIDVSYNFDGTYTRVFIAQRVNILTMMYLPNGPLFSYTGVGNIVEYDLSDWNAQRPPSALIVTGGSCCAGSTGNVNCGLDNIVDIGDLTRLIEYVFISYDPTCCLSESDIDGEGTVDINDITALIDFLFISFTPLSPCP